ncbi:hypothetical protein Q8F54_08370 [Leuconostoc mesenteroides]|uniref:hypothetical protein n=2 Tax=Leuconostoc mesenteroides TaxID=1245 RepID=UPI000E096FD3|nr:hypothetical protein [Leuconostoc mesenteroides]KAA8366306.1 hypothetical protein FE417_09370 [Leuconostoc mesenteroides]RDG14178.1 hypothetical protein DQM12_07265 [Leuconostoc mesenteroides subsp. mesenteroides]WMS39424.1 hypothetical protein Q8F54_08370 [Leuconostoc mesenteroides]
MAVDMEDWFEGLNAETEEPSAFGFEDGETEATLTDVSLFESSSSSWSAVQFEFTDKEGNTDNGYRVSISKKKTDGSKIPAKMWQRNVFQLMRPLILANPKFKAVVDLDTINQGNAAVVEALQVLVDKLEVRLQKTTPEHKPNETVFPEYTFLKPLEF